MANQEQKPVAVAEAAVETKKQSKAGRKKFSLEDRVKQLIEVESKLNHPDTPADEKKKLKVQAYDIRWYIKKMGHVVPKEFNPAQPKLDGFNKADSNVPLIDLVIDKQIATLKKTLKTIRKDSGILLSLIDELAKKKQA